VANAAHKPTVTVSLPTVDKLAQLQILQQQLEDLIENLALPSELEDQPTFRRELSKAEASNLKSAEVVSILISEIKMAA